MEPNINNGFGNVVFAMRTRQQFVAITPNMLAAPLVSVPRPWCERIVRTIPIRCGLYLLNGGASLAPEDIPFKKKKRRETLMARCRKRSARLNRPDKSLLSVPPKPHQINGISVLSRLSNS